MSQIEVIIIVSDIEEEVIKQSLNELKLDLRIELVSIPYNRDFGTADSLRLIKDKVKVCIDYTDVLNICFLTFNSLQRMIFWSSVVTQLQTFLSSV